METLRPDRTEEGGNAQAFAKSELDGAKNKRGRGWEGNSDLATKCNKRDRRQKQARNTWSSLTCVKVGQEGKCLKQPGPYQRTMGKPEETAKWQNREFQERGRQGQATLSIDPKNCRETVKAPSRIRTVSTKAKSSRQLNGKEPTPGMRKTGPSHTLSFQEEWQRNCHRHLPISRQ